MSKNELKYRAICPNCKKPFDLRKDGHLCEDGRVYCSKCVTFKTFFDNKIKKNY